MPIKGDLYDFTDDNISKSPDQHGVYALYDASRILTYVGRASGTGVTIRSRLRDHKVGRDGACTKAAKYYRREVTEAAISREKELLDEYKASHNNKLPSCNEVSP